MERIILNLLLFFAIHSWESKAQIVIQSQPTVIDFKNPYTFNSTIEKSLETDNQMGQFQAFLDYSNKGNFKKAQELDDKSRKIEPTTPLTQKQIDSINFTYSAVDAVDYIVEQAKRNKITIINEAHHNPRHRVFTRALLKKLYGLGYTHLGLEALYNGQQGGTSLANGAKIRDEKDLDLNKRGYPVRKSGAYIKEPQLGNLVRYALELGFTVFSYEKPGVGSGYPREVGQAKNIQAMLSENPNAKMLIHVGFAHVYEGTYSSWGKAMAGQLKELTGIDPLTIDQVHYSEHSKPEYNNALYNALSLKKSSVLVGDTNIAMGFTTGEAYTDIAVMHPPTDYLNTRPSWLFQGEVKDIEMNTSLFGIHSPKMILVFKSGENIQEAIPVDIVEIENDSNNEIHLALKPGSYTIVAASIEGNAKKVEVLVKQ